ncbi:hypothetical protein PI124_g20481 [Phytophthora idaei]|nr:hypothetical protein PI125_g21794 [Phytophthora idaei]KAG3131236.1 hypothetical protein PI126_g20151 [Phytophthora idaei]KAG3234463.1 hypothetical protein PI124_g20481 [Phytophthora idaei]
MSRSATSVSKSTPAPDLLPENPFGPDSDFIPGRLQPRQLDATAIAPRATEKLNRVTIVAMMIGSLLPDLPLKTGWIFPHEGEDVTLSDYHDDLVPQPQIESLMAAKPWVILSTNSGSAISFHTDVGGRLELFLGAYRQFEIKHWMALWEGTHKFPISRPKIAKSPWLADFNKKRGNRRSHAGADWKKILVIFILTIQDGWCDYDLLLDPFFLQLPKRHHKVIWFPGVASRRANLAVPTLNRSESATLLEALDECNTADPWRNHFRDAPGQHPAHQIPRLAGKFFSVRAARTSRSTAS